MKGVRGSRRGSVRYPGPCPAPGSVKKSLTATPPASLGKPGAPPPGPQEKERSSAHQPLARRRRPWCGLAQPWSGRKEKHGTPPKMRPLREPCFFGVAPRFSPCPSAPAWSSRRPRPTTTRLRGKVQKRISPRRPLRGSACWKTKKRGPPTPHDLGAGLPFGWASPSAALGPLASARNTTRTAPPAAQVDEASWFTAPSYTGPRGGPEAKSYPHAAQPWNPQTETTNRQSGSPTPTFPFNGASSCLNVCHQ